MRLADIRDVITELGISRPWGFTGADLRATLEEISLSSGPIQPPLTDDLEIDDAFFLVEHCGHRPSSNITGFESLSEMERWLLSDGGYTNPFVTFTVAFVEGRPRPFRILYRDRSGNDAIFDKEQQLSELEHSFDDSSELCASRRLEWL
jgi:hypothetical protein